MHPRLGLTLPLPLVPQVTAGPVSAAITTGLLGTSASSYASTNSTTAAWGSNVFIYISPKDQCVALAPFGRIGSTTFLISP